MTSAPDRHRRVLLPARPTLPDDEMVARSSAFASQVQQRRTVRDFADRPVPRAVIEHCLRAAGTAPSGAHQQPWQFVVITEPRLKAQVRAAAEASEAEFYATAPQEWLDALAPIGTDAVKPYLETAPYLIAVFAERYGVRPDGTRRTHYYVNESVGIACGILLTALHDAGLATLTHTPSPMGFLAQLLERPPHEKAVMLIVVGHAASGATVPDLQRKPLEDYVTFR